MVIQQSLVTAIMQQADCFESWKVVANVKELSVGSLDDAKKIIIAASQATDNRLEVVAAWIPGTEYAFITEKDVRVISDGKEWSVLSQVLLALGCYPPAVEAKYGK